MDSKRKSFQQQARGGKAKRARKDAADTIFYGGDIITMDDNNKSKVEAIAISGGVIIEVGSIDRVFACKGPETEVIFLNKQTLMPGFIEPHQHATMTSQMSCVYTNISALNYRSYAEVKKVMDDKIKEVKASAIDNKWALFFGWDAELIPDLPTLSATFLDDNFSKDVAVAVVGQSGHVAWVNQIGLTKAGIDNKTPNPPGGTYVKDENNELTGQLLEDAAILGALGHAPVPDGEVIFQSVVNQWKYYASVGLTTVTDLAYTPNEGFDSILKNLAERDDCPIRLGMYHLHHPSLEDATEPGKLKVKRVKPSDKKVVSCCSNLGATALSKVKHVAGKQGKEKLSRARTAKSGAAAEEEEDEPIGYFNDKLWEIGIKLIADGSPHCGTAAVQEPFLHTPLTETLVFPTPPSYGYLNYTTEEFLATVRRFTKEGKQCAIHCHGERACEQIMKVYEQVLAEDSTNSCRHRMEHLGLMTVDQITRAGKLNIALSFFVDHLRFYGSVYKTGIFGEERVNRWTPISEATKNGVTWTIHQDHPTFPGDATPFANMKTAITRTCRDDPKHPYGPEYCVSIDEALRAYTINAAWQINQDRHLGSITVGKKADLVVLSENPYNTDPFDLEEIKVVETFLGGHRNEFATVATVPGLPGQLVLKA